MLIGLALIDYVLLSVWTIIAGHAHWFGIDRLRACVRGKKLIADRVHWFWVDRLRACVQLVDIDS